MTPAVVSSGICFAKSQGCQFLDICLVDIATGYFHFIALFALDLVVQNIIYIYIYIYIYIAHVLQLYQRDPN